MKYVSGHKRLQLKNVRDGSGKLFNSPYDLGKLGGRMTQVMVQAAQDFLAREIEEEVRKNFRANLHQQSGQYDLYTDPN
ncbi:MAG TPA: hypothetical protein GXZ36_06335 [Firmicutes bacterium]|nr:hypothetical protein [Bacillota bacterium]